MMLTLHNIAYIHPDKEPLFTGISFSMNRAEKVALVGNNGSGKSTLLKIIAGQLQSSHGNITLAGDCYYLPQVLDQYNDVSIAAALGVKEKFQALEAILSGDVQQQHLDALNDEWDIEERCGEALLTWQLNDLDLNRKMGTLSGGQKMKVFLAGIAIHRPALVLLDEPGNHLDAEAKQMLCDFIHTTTTALLMVSHDRVLLNLLPRVFELGKTGLTIYGGNYDFYAEQKAIAREALSGDLHSKEKELRKVKEKERETMERQQKLDARGKGRQEAAGVARIMMNTLRNQAENSTSRIKAAHSEKIDSIVKEVKELRASIPDLEKMKLGFTPSSINKSKILFKARELNHDYGGKKLWPKALSFEITGGERIALKGPNGSGKTTLINMILGRVSPQAGTVSTAGIRAVYIDQEYSLLNGSLSVYEQAQLYNTGALQEHEIKIRLNWFLFDRADWDKCCSDLSGGERMRLLLCCLTISNQSPDIIILDEPTNNLDIANIEILTNAIRHYQGALLVVSHDARFLSEIGIRRTMAL